MKNAEFGLFAYLCKKLEYIVQFANSNLSKFFSFGSA
jgi:hypothetical protein